MIIKTEIQARDVRKKGRGGRWHKCGSLLNNFMLLLLANMSNTTQTVRDVLGGNVNQGAASVNFNCVALAGITAVGIVIGSGTAAVALSDYRVNPQLTVNIAHGPMNFSIENPTASVCRVIASRTFQNNTGAAFECKEVGLYGDLGVSVNSVCLDRTLFGVRWEIAQTKQISYRITIML